MPSPWFQPDLDQSRSAMPRPEYPRPDFQRGTTEGIDWLNLNGIWAFEFDPDNRGKEDHWYESTHSFHHRIIVPFPWESHLAWEEGHLASNHNWYSLRAFQDPVSVNHTNYQHRPRYEVGWYRNTVYIPQHWTGKRTILHFGAVDWETTVWVNGALIGRHEGGYTPFEFDITDACPAGETAVITIRVFDPNDHRTLPAGKQINWYARTSGIWQTVYLEPRHETYIKSVHITPDLDRGSARIQAHIEGVVSDPKLRITMTGPDGRTLQETHKADDASIEMEIPDPVLWEPDAPHMYDAAVELLSETRQLDRIHTSFGMRKVSVDVLPGTITRYIFLNNRPIYLLGALNQSFNPWGVYTFPSDEAILDDLRKTKAFGFNFLRIHIKIEEPRFLYWADRLGVLLMCDIPNFGNEGYGAETQFRWEETLRGTIERDYNHPSIIAWCCFNETWGLGSEEYKNLPDRQEWVRAMYHLTRSLDASRLVEDNSPCLYDHVETQINSWHFYINDYDRARAHIAHVVEQTYPGSSFNYAGNNVQGDEPLMNSEYGGISARMGDKDISWCFKFLTNELRLHEKICGYIYTELQDIEWEHNGFMNYDRTVKEFGYDYRMINAPDMVLIDGPPGQVQPGGSRFEIDIMTSHFSHRAVESAVLRWRLDSVDHWGRDTVGVIGGNTQIPFTRYRVEKVHRIEMTLPGGNRLCTFHVWIEDGYGAVVARNFTTIEIYDGPLPNIDLNPDHLAVRYESGSPVSADWTGGTLEEGDMMTGLGIGAFEYRLGLPDGMDFSNVTSLELWSELSAGCNGAPQTEPDRRPSEVAISLNGVTFDPVFLHDAPADHRGALSYIHGGAGRYGELICVIATGNDLSNILDGISDNEMTVRYEVGRTGAHPNGMALFGARAGRYPVQPCVVFRFRQ